MMDQKWRREPCLLPVVVMAVVRTALCNGQHRRQLLRLLRHWQGNVRRAIELGQVQRWPREASSGYPERSYRRCFSTAVMDTPIPAEIATAKQAKLLLQCIETR